MDIKEAENLLSKITELNSEITKIEIRIQEKKDMIKTLLEQVQVKSIEDLDKQIKDNTEILNKLLNDAKIQYNNLIIKVEETKKCLQN